MADPRIIAVDMMLRDRLAGTIELDFDAACRLFTLLCVLHLS